MTASEVLACPACGVRNRVPAVASGTPRCAACHRDLPWLVEAGEADFESAIDTGLPVLVDLWAPWCGPCRTVAPTIQRCAGEFAGSMKVVKVNVDNAPAISARLGIQGIPTLLVLRRGEIVSRQVGALPERQLLDWVRSSIHAAAA